MNYKATEKAIFDFLYKKFQEDNSFTFSVRKKATKGAETNYFLGTENSKYFAFTHWNIPSAYKGASRDLINYKIDLKNNSCLLSSSYRMVRNPKDEQNKCNLELGKYIKKHWEAIGITHETTSSDVNNYDLIIRYTDPIKSISELEKALDKFISKSYNLTNQAIDELKSIRPNWNAGRISLEEFNLSIQKLNVRLTKYSKNHSYYIIGSKYNANKDVFPLFMENKVIAINMYSKEDLTDLYLKPEKKIVSYLKDKNEKTNSYSALKKFLSIKVGDKIAVKSDGSPKGKQGYLKIVGFAEVVERNGVVYQFDKSLGHTLNVKFTNAPINLEFTIGGYGSTIHKLSNVEQIKTIFENKNDTSLFTKNINLKNKANLNFPLNQILFGPPGTGKTYQTRKLAYEIIQDEKLSNTKDDFEKSLQLFKDLKGEQIEFITFHQNYSYEDFVQGLRPDVEAGEMRFKKHNGVFFKIAKRAKDNYLKSQNKPQEVDVSFEDVFDALCEPLENGMEIPIRMKQATYHITDIVDENRIKFRKQSGGTGHDLLINTVKALYEKTIRYIKTGLGIYYHPLDRALQREAEKLRKQIKSEPLRNYVLIIDEINRANISRVFGELITLLEPSKRFGRTEELEVQLPSGDRFVVPPNLYLIGTMNTADKSIALLDIALRRRFEFVPVFPNKELVVEEYKDLFDKMNNKIASLKSPDFTIGHSYFMADENDEKPELEDIMNNKVIPLLCEYFMNDLDRVERLLKDIGVILKREHYGILRFDKLKTEKTNDEAAN